MAEEHKIKEVFSENLGVKYLVFPDFFLTETGVRLTRAEVSGRSHKYVKTLYDMKKVQLEPFDYEYAKTTSFLRKKREDKPAPVLAEQSLPEPVAQVRQVNRFIFSPITFITIVTVLVGFAMLIVSVSYTHEHIEKYTPPVIAWVFAIGLCSFASIAFESSLLFWKMQGCKPLSVFFAVLFVIVLSFTVSANADVIYAKCRTNQNTAVHSASGTEAAAQVQALTKVQAEAKKGEIDAAQKDLDTYLAGEKVNAWQAQVLRNALAKKKAEYNTLIEEQKRNLKDNPTIAKATLLSSDSFYDFLGSKVGMRSGDVETLLNMLSILFVDIIAPASFAVALFLGGKQNGKKESHGDRDEEEVKS